MRKVSTINISFGLVNIPAGMYPCHKEAKVEFNLFSECHNAPVRYKKVCQTCGGEVVSPKKGVKIDKENAIVFSEDELKNLPQTTQLTMFVPITAVSPLQFRGEDYYLAPEEGAERAFSLFAQLLATLGIGLLMKTTIRGKERLCFIRSVEGSTVLSFLYFPEEIRPAPPSPSVAVSQKEMETAIALLKALIEEKVPWEKIKNETAEAIKNLISNKTVVPPPPSPPKEEEFLMALNELVKKKKAVQTFWR